MDRMLELLEKMDSELEEWRPVIERYKGGLKVGNLLVGAFKK